MSIQMVEGPPRSVEYREFTIRVTNEFEFIVSGEGWPEKGTDKFHSMGAAKGAIDDLLATKAKVAKAAGTLRIPYITEQAKRVVVKGFHQNTGEALTLADGPYQHGLYPDEPWIMTLLEERGRLHKRVNEINKKVGYLCVSGKVAYGRTDATHYDQRLEKFVKQLQAAAKAAMEHAPDAVTPPSTGVEGGD